MAVQSGHEDHSETDRERASDFEFNVISQLVCGNFKVAKIMVLASSLPQTRQEA